MENLGNSHYVEAEQWIQRAIAAEDKNGKKFHLGLSHALYGDLFKHQEDMTMAQNEYVEAAEILRECGADGWVIKFEKELANI